MVSKSATDIQTIEKQPGFRHSQKKAVGSE
jgi:hypothetical protein